MPTKRAGTLPLITSVFLNPLTDFGFKKVFLDKQLMVAFLNDIIDREHIVDVTFLPTEQLGDWEEERRAVYDLYCTTSAGEFVIVEMQLSHQKYFTDRALFYASHAIRHQAPKTKKWDFQLKAVYMVAIINSVLFKEPEVKDCVREEVMLYRQNMHIKMTDKLTFIFIELPKFNKSLEELKTNTDRWLFILKNLDRLKNRPFELQDRIFQRLFKIAQVKRLDKQEMKNYQTSMQEYMDFYGHTEVINDAAERRFGSQIQQLQSEIAKKDRENAEKDRENAEKDRENAELKRTLQQLLQQYNIPISALSKNN